MARCTGCSAPLPANTQHCRYCGVRNDIDLQGRHDYRIIGTGSGRICPECQQPLETLSLNGNALFIERCQRCFGLFFDPGEIETLLDSAVSQVFSINLALLANINKDRYVKSKPVKYLKCPVCHVLMNRVLFGHRSGVVMDQCKSHGVWLENGEITQLLEWKKAGGQLLHEKKTEALREQALRKRVKTRTESDIIMPGFDKPGNETDMLESLASLLFKVLE